MITYEKEINFPFLVMKIKECKINIFITFVSANKHKLVCYLRPNLEYYYLNIKQNVKS